MFLRDAARPAESMEKSSMPELPEDALPLLTRKDAIKFINDELGIPVAESTLDKKAMKGEGPTPAAYYGKRELYSAKTIKDWALGLCSDEPAKLGAE